MTKISLLFWKWIKRWRIQCSSHYHSPTHFHSFRFICCMHYSSIITKHYPSNQTITIDIVGSCIFFPPSPFPSTQQNPSLNLPPQTFAYLYTAVITHYMLSSLNLHNPPLFFPFFSFSFFGIFLLEICLPSLMRDVSINPLQSFVGCSPFHC